MASYKVRDFFYVHIENKTFEPGSVLEFDDEQAERYAVQIEPIEQPKPSKKAA